MISNINEGTLRTVSKIDTAGAVQERELSQQKAEEVRQVRPVEKSEAGAKSDKQKSEKEEDSSKYVVDDNQVFFEKYDSKGELILRIPPSQKPVDERV
ncbi:MAG: hypothetical protein P8X55_11125 [Desulfosarcinaceae bacterium]